MSKAPQVFKNFIPATVRVVGADSLAGQQLLNVNAGRIRQFYTTQRGIADTGVISLNRGMIDAPEITMMYKKIQGQEYVDVILRPVNSLTVPHPHKPKYKPTLTYITSSAEFTAAPNLIITDGGPIHTSGLPSPVAPNAPDWFFYHSSFIDDGVSEIYYLADLWRIALGSGITGRGSLASYLSGYSTGDNTTLNNLLGMTFDTFSYFDEYGNGFVAPPSYLPHTSVIKPNTIPATLTPLSGGQSFLWWKGETPYLAGGAALALTPQLPPQRRPDGHVGPWNPGPNTNLRYNVSPAILTILNLEVNIPPDPDNRPETYSGAIDLTPGAVSISRANASTLTFKPIGFRGFSNYAAPNGPAPHLFLDVLFKRVSTPA